MRSIKDAVHSDIAASRAIYNWVVKLSMSLGVAEHDLVPFDKYAQAALLLTSPSSAARALAAGAPHIERLDRLVQTIAAQHSIRSDVVDQTVCWWTAGWRPIAKKLPERRAGAACGVSMSAPLPLFVVEPGS